MGLRKIGFADPTVSGGFDNVDEEKKYRASSKRTDYIVFKTDAEEYRVHQIDDLVQNDDGEFKTFNTPCSKEWSDEEEDWVGQCLWCDEGYLLKERYITLINLVAQKKGKRVQPIDPENSTMYWDFAGTTYEKLRSLNNNTKGGILNKLVAIDCEDSYWQKITASLCTIDKMQKLWKNNKDKYDEQAEIDADLPARAVKPDSLTQQRNRLSKKKRRGKQLVSSGVSGSASQVSSNFEESNNIDDEIDDLIGELEELELED